MDDTDLYQFLSDSELVKLIEQVKISDDILDVIKLSENQHSDMLAWCLSPNEGHAQGDEVIKDFLLAAHAAAHAETRVATFDNKKFFNTWTPGRIRTSSFGAAFVAREFAVEGKYDDRKWRLDLFFVDPQNKIIIAIENKAGAKLNNTQLNEYHTAVKGQISKRPAFNDYRFLFVVLDRNLDDYDEEHLTGLGTKWALLDYSWLRDSANRARLQVARNNQAAQLLVAYCQKQTGWESPAEQCLSALAADLSMRHEKVVNAIRTLRKQKLAIWTPGDLQGHRGELLLFINQQQELCTHLMRAQGIAAVLLQIRQRLPALKSDHIQISRKRLYFASPKIEELSYQDIGGLHWPIYINVYREANDDETDNSKYTVRLFWCKEYFSDAIGNPDALREHFLTKFPDLRNFSNRNVRRIVINKNLDHIDAAKAAYDLATTIDKLLVTRPQ